MANDKSNTTQAPLAIEVVPFGSTYISSAIALWEATEHIGLSSADSPEALSRFLASNEGLSFCAAENGHLVGTILCGTDGRRGYVHHLAVTKRCRGHGIASRLLSQSLQALARIGIAKCHAFVFNDNPYAELFWQPSGWQLREDLLVYSRLVPRGA
jgi:ribosomal protein S18 acetylase RimI-like enzyme